MLYSVATKKLDIILTMVIGHPPSYKRVRAIKLLLDIAMQCRTPQVLWNKFLFASKDDPEKRLPHCLMVGLFAGVCWLCGKATLRAGVCGGACAPLSLIWWKMEVGIDYHL